MKKINKNGAEFIDLSGQKFGLLTVTQEWIIRGRHRFWTCICDCGNKKEITAGNLRSGGTKSCGCQSHPANKSSSKWKGKGDISQTIMCRYKESAKIRNLDFSVDIDYLWELFLKQDRKCVFTGVELYFPDVIRYNNRKIKASASLDRKDSSKGYVKGNLQWVHVDINYLKSNYTDKEFIDICKAVVKHKSTS